MSSPNQVQEFYSSPAIRRPSDFLSLAPATSATYPQRPRAQVTSEALAGLNDGHAAKRRTSSQSSDGTKSAASIRYLKLGPVHFGEHRDENQSDWHEAAVE